MGKLWIFGDSYSTSFNSELNKDIWARTYVDYKGYTPKSFGDIISEKRGLELMNTSIVGSDNDSIFELIYKNAPLIDKGDIIIIGWSSLVRFRIPKSSDDWLRVVPNIKNQVNLPYNISIQTLEETLYYRSLPIYVNEYRNRRDFINWLFKDNIVIHWTPFHNQFSFICGFPNINSIREETNFIVDDGHYSEIGHQQISDYLMDLIDNQKKREFYHYTNKNLL